MRKRSFSFLSAAFLGKIFGFFSFIIFAEFLLFIIIVVFFLIVLVVFKLFFTFIFNNISILVFPINVLDCGETALFNFVPIEDFFRVVGIVSNRVAFEIDLNQPVEAFKLQDGRKFLNFVVAQKHLGEVWESG